MLKAVLLDVDFTLFRPGPELGPEGYRRSGARHGLTLDPARYDEARRAAVANLQRHPELVHDEELWVAFTEEIVAGMGGDGPSARATSFSVFSRFAALSCPVVSCTHAMRMRSAIALRIPAGSELICDLSGCGAAW